MSLLDPNIAKKVPALQTAGKAGGEPPRADDDLSVFGRLSQAVSGRDSAGVRDLVQRLVVKEIDPFQILNQGLIPGILLASDRFRKREIFVPELLMSSRALKMGLNILRPLIRESCRGVMAKVVIGTVRFDLHDIGKNLVVILLEGNGFEVVDLGVDIPPDKFVKTVEKTWARHLLMSSLLTSTMGWMKTTIDLLGTSGLRGKVKTVVGGAPVTSIFARNIGADGYCREATAAPALARDLLGLNGSHVLLHSDK
jgi:5-methyltetrahydrofolate--homocysteine methyltransferase